MEFENVNKESRSYWLESMIFQVEQQQGSIAMRVTVPYNFQVTKEIISAEPQDKKGRSA